MSWLRWMFVLVVFSGLAGCGRKESIDAGEAVAAADSLIHLSGEVIRSGEVELGEMASRALADTLVMSGAIQPHPLSVAHVSTRVAGTIQRVHVVIGDRVQRGQALATLYSPEFLAASGDYLLAHQRAEQAERAKAADAQALRGIALSSRRRLEGLGADEGALANLDRTDQALTELTLRSPRDGVVTEAETGPGKQVVAGTDLFGITDLSGVWAVAEAYERDLGRLRIGQNAEVLASAYPERVFPGRISSLEGAINEATRTLSVRLEVGNPGLALKPGMFVSVHVATGTQRSALVLGEGAVQDLGANKVVFVAISDTTFVARPVEVRSLGGNQIEIVTGLRPGERVAIKGAFLLKSQALKGELGEE